MKHPFYFLHAGVNTGELSEGNEFCVQSRWSLVIRVEIDATLHARFIFTLFKRNGDDFVFMNEQGYQFMECDKNDKESDVLMTILMVMVMMMVVILIIMVKRKQQGSTHYQKSTVNVQYFTHVHSHTYNPGISSRFPASSSMFYVELSLKGVLYIRLVGKKGSLNTALTVLSNNEGHYWGETAVQDCHNSSDMSMKALLASRP